MLMRIKPRRRCLFLVAFLFNAVFFINSCQGDVGTAAQYNPPYLPTICYGNDASEFPSSNLFAAAGDGIWDNGASCGRQYLVRCISATQPGTCVPDQTIQIKIVDYAPSAPSTPSADGTTIVLSETAFGIVANSTAIAINIEFQQQKGLDCYSPEASSQDFNLEESAIENLEKKLAQLVLVT